MSTASTPSIPTYSFGWSLFFAVLIIVTGLIAIVVPMVSGIAITLVVGWFFSVVGILHFFFAWKTHSTRGVVWEILLGLLYLASAAYLLIHPVAGLASLTLILAVYLVFKAIVETVQYFHLLPRHGSVWLLVDAIVSLVLAFMIGRTWPFSSLWVIGTLVGISMVFTGVTRLMLVFEARRVLGSLTNT
jgi:uncharacterized membrane protein HdeD (DUF308 family)